MPYYRGRQRSSSKRRGFRGPRSDRTGNDNRTYADAVKFGNSSNSNLLQFILQKLDKLENRDRSNSRNNRSQRGRRNSRRSSASSQRSTDRWNDRNNKDRNSNRQTANRSDNPDFQDLIRLSFKYAQTAHHQHNWRNLPSSLSNRIDELVADIKPPSVSAKLQLNLERLANDFKSKILAEVSRHIDQVHLDSFSKLKSLNFSDWQASLDIAKNQLQRRLGKRLHKPSTEMAFDQIRDYFCEASTPSEISTPKPKIHPSRDHQTTSSRSRPSKRQKPGSDECSTEVDSDPSPAAPTKPVFHINPSTNVFTTTVSEPQPGIDTLVVIDSNGKSWKDLPLPCKWQVEVIPGCNLDSASDILSRSSTSLTDIHNIVIAVGINDRLADPDFVLNSMQRIKNWGSRFNKKIFFSSIPVFPLLIPNIQTAIEHINQTAQDYFGNRFITSIAPQDIELLKDDLTGIHYSPKSASIILNNIISALN